MSLIRRPNLESPKFASEHTPLPAGTYIARCVQVIELGTHTENYQGIEKNQPKLRVVWELPTEETTESTDSEGEKFINPKFIGKEFTISFYESSNLRKTLVSWRGADFTEEELDTFDLKNLLDKPCMLNLGVKTSDKTGKTYNVLSAVSPMMKGLECPARISDLVYFDLSENDGNKFNKLPKFLQEKILESKEMQS